MNLLGTINQKNIRTSEIYPILSIDGQNIGELVGLKAGNEIYKELVPTFLHWLYDERSRDLVWSRAFPSIDEELIAPVLMCPDDTDLWCYLIVAKVTFKNELYTWLDLGLENGGTCELSELGREVNWFNLGPYSFTKENYFQVLNQFKK